jgi:hypothetical protein
MKQVIHKIEDSLSGISEQLFAGTAPESTATSLLEFYEKKMAFYTGMANGFKIALSVLKSAKGVIKKVNIIKAKIVIDHSYSYVAYLRTINILKNMIHNIECKLYNNNPVQTKKMEGQIAAIQTVVDSVNDDFNLNTNYQQN